MPFLQSVAQRFIGSTVRYPMKEIMFLILCVAISVKVLKRSALGKAEANLWKAGRHFRSLLRVNAWRI